MNEMERAAVDGLELEYEVRGSGEPVVLIHWGVIEHERGGPFPHFVDEGVEGGKLLIPADDLGHHPPRNDRDRGRKGNIDPMRRGPAQ